MLLVWKCIEDLLKMREETRNIKLKGFSKEIWGYLLLKGVTITAKHPSSVMNTYVDKASLQENDSSELKLNLEISQIICKILENQKLDLFTFRLTKQTTV